jgi:hypothetical protein
MDHTRERPGSGHVRDSEDAGAKPGSGPEAAGRREAIRRGTIARIAIVQRGREARRRIARLLDELRAFLPPLWALVLILGLGLLAAMLCSCIIPVLAAEGRIAILDAREVALEEGWELVISYRVSAEGRLELERFCATFRFEGSLGPHWVSDIVSAQLPCGASLVSSLTSVFADPSERYVDGSAVLESSWFE